MKVGLGTFSKCRRIPLSVSQARLLFANRRDGSCVFEEGVDGARSTTDKKADFFTARMRVDLPLRLRLLAVSSDCGVGGIGGKRVSLPRGSRKIRGRAGCLVFSAPPLAPSAPAWRWSTWRPRQSAPPNRFNRRPSFGDSRPSAFQWPPRAAVDLGCARSPDVVSLGHFEVMPRARGARSFRLPRLPGRFTVSPTSCLSCPENSVREYLFAPT